MKIVKNCEIHGDLTIDQVGPYKNKVYKNGDRPTHYYCKECRTNKRNLKPKRINASQKYKKINTLFDKLDCFYCKENKIINEFNDYQLSVKYPKCSKCESEMNRHYYILAKYKLTKLEKDGL